MYVWMSYYIVHVSHQTNQPNCQELRVIKEYRKKVFGRNTVRSKKKKKKNKHLNGNRELTCLQVI